MMIAQDPNSFTKSSNTSKRHHGQIDTGSVGLHKNCDQVSNFENKDGSKRLMISAPDDEKNVNRGNSSDGINAMKSNELHATDDKRINERDRNESNSSASNDNNPVVLDEEGEETEEEEPDWASIAEHEPAKRDVPLFLDARERREAAEARFASALDEAHAILKLCNDALLKTAADLYNVQREKLDSMEVQIKHDFVENEVARSQMQSKLEESATAAQAEFAQLMMRVTKLGKSLSSK